MPSCVQRTHSSSCVSSMKPQISAPTSGIPKRLKVSIPNGGKGERLLNGLIICLHTKMFLNDKAAK